MVEKLTLKCLQDAVSGNAAAFRCRRRLQPAGGEGDKVFPPTFAGAVYAVEQRRVRREKSGPVETATCVLLDGVASEANRMELALQEALDAGRIKIPVLEVDFTEYEPTGDVEADEKAGRLIDSVGKVTSLQVPHRLADAILRDSEFESVAFRKSEKGKALNSVSPASATALFSLCPTALVFGMWDSTGPKGGLGPKFERALVSEIVGIGAEVGQKTQSRIDPLINSTARIELYQKKGGGWTLDEKDAVLQYEKKDGKGWILDEAEAKPNGKTSPIKFRKEGKASEANLGNVTPTITTGGVTIDYAEQTTTLSLICLRRLRFPIDGSDAGTSEEANEKARKEAEARDVVARTVLAALGLCGATLAFEGGVGLRSRCLLWPDEPMEWELLARPGEEPKRYSLTGDEAIALLNEAVAGIDAAKLPWESEPIALKPSAELLKLVRLSQREAIKEGPDAG